MKTTNLEYMEITESEIAVYDENGIIGEFHVWEDNDGSEYILYKRKMIYLSKMKEIWLVIRK